jgi:hypothetical protein
MRLRAVVRLLALVLLTGFVVSSPPPLGAATTDTFRDEFNNISYSGDDGIGGSWAGAWLESESPQNPAAGNMKVLVDGTESFALHYTTGGTGDFVERTADLAAYDTASLSFDYRRDNANASFSFKVWASANGPSGPFTEIFAITPGNDALYVASGSVNISGYRSATTTIRFSHEAGSATGFYVDNVEIAATTGNLPPVADATNGAPYVINEGDPVTLDGSASFDPELAPLTYAWDLDNDGNFGEPGEPAGAAALAGMPLVLWATLQSFGIDDDGSYPIGLRVTDDALQFDTTTTTLTVNNTAPTITATGAASVDKDAVYTLNLSAVDPGNETIIGWTINWGDGKTVTVGDVSLATHVYGQSGFTRNITVSVTDGDGTFIPGDVLVTSLATDSLFRFDATSGVLVEEFADLNGLDNPIDVEIGPDGLVYVSGFASNDITRYDATTGAFVSQFIAPGTGGLNAPARMVFGPDGDLYISNYPTDEVLRFDGSSGAFIDVFVSAGSGTLDQPDGITFGPDGNLYVVSGASGRILRYDGSSGAFIDIFALLGPGGTGYADLVFGPDSNLYASSVSLNKVQRFDGSTGVKINDFVATGSGGVGGADGLAFGPDGYLYVVGFTSHNVLRYNATSGAFVDEYASAAVGMSQPVNLVFTPAEQVFVNPVNGDPVAVDDADSTLEDTPVTVDVLGNDTDPDLDALLIDSVTQGSNGSVVNNGTDVTYTPDPDWNGTDTFTYTVTDGNGGFDTATVTVDVASVNDDPVAVDDSDGTAEDTPVIVDVLGNDSDPDLDALSVDSATQGSNGSVVNNGTDVTYTPDLDWYGTDSFTYTMTDGNGGFSTAQVTVTVSPVNDDPTALSDTKTVDEDSSETIPVLDNDSDIEGDSLTISGVIDGPNGSVVNNGTNVTYIPNPDWSGVDTFMYTISDGNGGSASAFVTVTVNPVNDDPQGMPDSGTTFEDTPVVVEVLANDSDVDSSALTVTAVADGSNGTVTTDGIAVTYTPDPDWFGADTFTYRVSDDLGAWCETTVTVLVRPVNDDPIAFDDIATTPRDTAVYIWVLDNDTDVDPDTLTVSGFTSGADGTVVNNSNNVTYTPAPGWTGTDTFTYTVSDGNGGTDSATVTVTVTAGPNRPPVAKDDVKTIDEDAPVTIAVLANDSDPDGDGITVSAVNQGAHGSVTKTAASVTYTPDRDWTGIDSFGYSITDGRGGTATAEVVITVKPVNDPPTARDDSKSTPEATSVAIAVLANDSDVDGDPLAVATIIQGTRGVTTTDGNTVTYSPSPGWSGTDSFTYTITDGHGGSDEATVLVYVGTVNRPPTISVTGDASVAEDDPLVLEISVVDPDGDEVGISANGLPDWASMVDHGDGRATISGTPGFDADPSSEITISASDGTVTARFTITIDVVDVNRAPLIHPITFSGVNDDGSFSFAIAASDPDGDPLAISVNGLSLWATLTDHGDGTATISSGGVPDDVLGSFSAIVSVNDGQSTVTSSLSRPISDLRLGLPPEFTHQAFGTDGTDTLVATALKPRVGTPDPLGAHLTPREGLLVAFGSAVETMKNQVIPAVVLGVFMAWMLMIGVGRTKEEEEPEAA